MLEAGILEKAVFWEGAKVHAVNSLLRSSRPKRRIKKRSIEHNFLKTNPPFERKTKNETKLAKIYLLEIGFRVVIESKT